MDPNDSVPQTDYPLQVRSSTLNTTLTLNGVMSELFTSSTCQTGPQTEEPESARTGQRNVKSSLIIVVEIDF